MVWGVISQISVGQRVAETEPLENPLRLWASLSFGCVVSASELRRLAAFLDQNVMLGFVVAQDARPDEVPRAGLQRRGSVGYAVIAIICAGFAAYLMAVVMKAPRDSPVSTARHG